VVPRVFSFVPTNATLLDRFSPMGDPPQLQPFTSDVCLLSASRSPDSKWSDPLLGDLAENRSPSFMLQTAKDFQNYIHPKLTPDRGVLYLHPPCCLKEPFAPVRPSIPMAPPSCIRLSLDLSRMFAAPHLFLQPTLPSTIVLASIVPSLLASGTLL